MKNTVRKTYLFLRQGPGVGFRYRSYYIAQSLGLTGWVTNLWDGRVEMEVQGQTFDIQELLKTYPGTKLDRSIRYGDRRYPL